MIEEARLAAVDSGLAPASEGWFVINAADAAWLTNDAFGDLCIFESDDDVVRGHPDLEPQPFRDLGVSLRVLWPGQPNGMYHAEQDQEDFLVVLGECLLLIEEDERPLRAWDFVHCPPGTNHIFVGAGDGPCVIVMMGSRTRPDEIVYPLSEFARRHGAGVETETRLSTEAYARHPKWRIGRSDRTDKLPWDA
jgi:uncharacterized cupin superfamily protein